MVAEKPMPAADEILLLAKDEPGSATKGGEKPNAAEQKEPSQEPKPEPQPLLPGEKGPNLDPANERLPLIPEGLGDKFRLRPQPDRTAGPDQGMPEKKSVTGSPVKPLAEPVTPAEPRELPLSPTIPGGSSTRGLRWLERGLLNERVDRPGSMRRWYDAPLASDPLGRAAAYNALTPAESLLDGLGGIPSPRQAGFEGAPIPSGARVFRIGPVTLRGSASIGATYEKESRGQVGNSRTSPSQESASAEPKDSVSPTASTSGVTASSNNGEATDSNTGANAAKESSSNNRSRSSNSADSRGQIEEVAFQAALNFDFILGEPLTGHFMLASYGVAFDTGGGEAGQENQPLSQSLALLGRLDFAKLKLGMGLSFDSLSGQNRDVAGKADRDLLGLSLNASYPIGAKTMLDWDILLPFRQFEGGVGTGGITSSSSINYQYSPKLSLGLGYAFSFEQAKQDQDDKSSERAESPSEDSDVPETTDEVAADQTKSSSSTKDQRTAKDQRSPQSRSNRSEGSKTSNNIYLRAAFEVSPKLSLAGDVGVQFTQYEEGDSVSPIASLDVIWAPRSKTKLSLTLRESLQTSASTIGENFLSTYIALGINQQLGNRLNLGVVLGYEHAVYDTMGVVEQNGRVDDLFSAQIVMSLSLNSRWSASLSFSYSDNRSTDESSRFTSTLVQLQTSFAF